jgi:lipoyl(octanoyl) transferase
MSKGRLLIHPGGAATWNMAVDAYLVRAATSPLTLRCYTWSPATLSLGHIQKWTPELKSRCAKWGFSAVRRETGGRAVLHDQELTYSVSIPVGSPYYTSSLPEAYNRINRALAAGVRLLGVDAKQEERKLNLKEAYRQELGDLCFAATAKSEVLWDGRKLIGSAQRQLREGLLQHGSLIFTMAHEAISRLFFDDEGLVQIASKKLRRSTTCLDEALESLPSFETVTHALQRGFEAEFNLTLVEQALRPEEEKIVQGMQNAFMPENDRILVPWSRETPCAPQL